MIKIKNKLFARKKRQPDNADVTDFTRLYAFLETHNILYEKQFGFRKNNSTIFALMQITEKIKESIDKGKYGCGILIDLRKAFDTVNHGILLLKLEHYGTKR